MSPDGWLCVLGSNSVMNGSTAWQFALRDALARFGPEEPSGPPQPRLSHKEVLSQAGFDPVLEESFPHDHEWSVDDVVGFLRSTAFASRAALGGSVEAAERSIADRLIEVEPSGRFVSDLSYFYIPAKPA